MKPLLTYPLYAPLKDVVLFNRAYLDYGVVSWNDGAIDIATNTLYEEGVKAEKVSA